MNIAPEVPDLTYAEYKKLRRAPCPLCNDQMYSTGWGWKCKKHGEFKHSELGDEKPCENFSEGRI